jgi:Cytochrome c3
MQSGGRSARQILRGLWRASGTTDGVQCHGGKSPKAVSKLLCADCHGSPQDMARKTAALKIRNPHISVHFGTSLPCEECHKEHRASYNYCTACHRTWPNKIP